MSNIISRLLAHRGHENLARIVRNASVIPEGQDVSSQLADTLDKLNPHRFAKNGIQALRSAVMVIAAEDEERTAVPIQMKEGLLDTINAVSHTEYILTYGRVSPFDMFLNDLQRNSDVLQRNGLEVTVQENPEGEYQTVLTFRPDAEPGTLGAVVRDRQEKRAELEGPGF